MVQIPTLGCLFQSRLSKKLSSRWKRNLWICIRKVKTATDAFVMARTLSPCQVSVAKCEFDKGLWELAVKYGVALTLTRDSVLSAEA